MKCLTLTQPYATLITIGAKHIETRSWATSYRGELAIHAGTGLGPVGGKQGLMDLCRSEPFRSTLLAAGYLGTPALPLGAIVAICELVDCVRTQYVVDAGRCTSVSWESGEHTIWTLTDHERAFGDYSSGRYAWLLSNVRPLTAPIPARGALGLWEWERTV